MSELVIHGDEQVFVEGLRDYWLIPGMMSV
jgi:hypothetical protein